MGATVALGNVGILMPLGRGRRRHDDDQLRHLLPRARPRASTSWRDAVRARRALAPTARALLRARRGDARRRAGGAEATSAASARVIARGCDALGYRTAAAPQRARLRRAGRLLLRLPDRTPSARPTSATCRSRSRRARSSSPALRAERDHRRAAAARSAWWRGAADGERRSSRCARARWWSPAARCMTPLLLERSGIGGRSGQLGRNLSIHPAPACSRSSTSTSTAGTGSRRATRSTVPRRGHPVRGRVRAARHRGARRSRCIGPRFIELIERTIASPASAS